MTKIFGVVQFELLPGVTEADWEAFVASLDPLALNQSGMTLHLLRGDRGERKGRYALLMEFESIETRDRIFPIEGQGIADAALVTKLQPFFEGMGKRFDSDWKWTDYMEMD